MRGCRSIEDGCVEEYWLLDKRERLLLILYLSEKCAQHINRISGVEEHTVCCSCGECATNQSG